MMNAYRIQVRNLSKFNTLAMLQFAINDCNHGNNNMLIGFSQITNYCMIMDEWCEPSHLLNAVVIYSQDVALMSITLEMAVW